MRSRIEAVGSPCSPVSFSGGTFGGGGGGGAQRMLSEQILTAEHRRSARRVRRDRENTAVAQQAGPTGVSLDPPKMRAIHIPDPIEASQTFVRERIVRRQELRDWTTLTHLTFKEQFRLALERVPQVVVEIRKLVRIRIHGLHVPKEEPLTAEILHQRRRASIGQHAPNLLFKDVRILEFAARRHIEELVVRDTAPKEERQPGGQFEIADPIDPAGLIVSPGRAPCGTGMAEKSGVVRARPGCQSRSAARFDRSGRTEGAARRRHRRAAGDRRAVPAWSESSSRTIPLRWSWATWQMKIWRRLGRVARTCVEFNGTSSRTYTMSICWRLIGMNCCHSWLQQRPTGALRHRAFLDERDAKRVHLGLGHETNLERVIWRELVYWSSDNPWSTEDTLDPATQHTRRPILNRVTWTPSKSTTICSSGVHRPNR